MSSIRLCGISFSWKLPKIVTHFHENRGSQWTDLRPLVIKFIKDKLQREPLPKIVTPSVASRRTTEGPLFKFFVLLRPKNCLRWWKFLRLSPRLFSVFNDEWSCVGWAGATFHNLRLMKTTFDEKKETEVEEEGERRKKSFKSFFFCSPKVVKQRIAQASKQRQKQRVGGG